jgi:hypothetical protein
MASSQLNCHSENANEEHRGKRLGSHHSITRTTQLNVEFVLQNRKSNSRLSSEQRTQAIKGNNNGFAALGPCDDECCLSKRFVDIREFCCEVDSQEDSYIGADG